jgi:endonuclease IV
MEDNRFEHIPLILETTDPELWSKEVAMLRGFAHTSS